MSCALTQDAFALLEQVVSNYLARIKFASDDLIALKATATKTLPFALTRKTGEKTLYSSSSRKAFSKAIKMCALSTARWKKPLQALPDKACFMDGACHDTLNAAAD